MPFITTSLRPATCLHSLLTLSDTETNLAFEQAHSRTPLSNQQNGIDLTRFAFRPAPAVEPYLAWQGRIVPEKGLEFAIAAAQILGMKLRIAGPSLDRKYFETAVMPHLGDDIVYEGHLAHGALSELVGGARALLVLSLIHI